MANQKISELTESDNCDGTELVAVVQSSTTKKATLNTRVKAYFDTLYQAIFSRAEWRADTHAGYGGTDTRIPYFTNVRVNSDTGSALTVVNNSTNGTRITINTAGRYAVSFWAFPSAASYIGISLNSNQLTTNIQSIDADDRIALATSAGASYAILVSWTGTLSATDVIRPHSDATGTGGSALHGFSICRVG